MDGAPWGQRAKWAINPLLICVLIFPARRPFNLRPNFSLIAHLDPLSTRHRDYYRGFYRAKGQGREATVRDSVRGPRSCVYEAWGAPQ